MTASLFFMLSILAVLLVSLVVAVRAWLHVRGARLVVCPETQMPAAVSVDVGHAIATALREKPDLRLTSCSRWPERHDCDQPCVQQIEAAPSETRAETIATHFFDRERCAICRCRIEPSRGVSQQPGFMHPVTRQVARWNELPTETLPRAIAAWRPLCSNCTLKELFRQRFPDSVTDRLPH